MPITRLELLLGKVPRVFWYSLYDLPQAWEATTRHKEAEDTAARVARSNALALIAQATRHSVLRRALLR